MLAASAMPEMMRKASSRFMPPRAKICSKYLTAMPPYTYMGTGLLYPYGYLSVKCNHYISHPVFSLPTFLKRKQMLFPLTEKRPAQYNE